MTHLAKGMLCLVLGCLLIPFLFVSMNIDYVLFFVVGMFIGVIISLMLAQFALFVLTIIEMNKK